MKYTIAFFLLLTVLSCSGPNAKVAIKGTVEPNPLFNPGEFISSTNSFVKENGARLDSIDSVRACYFLKRKHLRNKD